MVLTFTGRFADAELSGDVFVTVIFRYKKVEYLSAAIRQILDLPVNNLEAYRLPPFCFFNNQVFMRLILPFTPGIVLFAEADTFIHHDPFQPAAELLWIFQLTQVTESDDERLLQEVFCIGSVARHPGADIEHGLTVLAVQPGLRVRIALAGFSHYSRLYVDRLFQCCPVIRV